MYTVATTVIAEMESTSANFLNCNKLCSGATVSRAKDEGERTQEDQEAQRRSTALVRLLASSQKGKTDRRQKKT